MRRANILVLLALFPAFIIGQENSSYKKNDISHWKYNITKDAYFIWNNKNLQVSDLAFQSPTPFRKGIASAKLDSGYVFILSNGKPDTFLYDYIWPATEGYFRVKRKNKKPVYYNRDQTERSLVFFNHRNFGSKRRFTYELEGKKGIIDTSGNFITPAIYDELTYLPHYDQFTVKKEGKVGQLDCFGKIVVPFKFSGITALSQVKLLLVKSDSLFGLIDQKGNIKVPMIYQVLIEINTNLLKYKKNQKWGIINKDGLEILPPVYDRIETYSKVNINIYKKDLVGLLDTFGKEILPLRYNAVYASGNNYVFADHGKTGLLSATGEILLAANYREIYPVDQTNYMVRSEKNWGVYAEKGKWIIPPEYPFCTALAGNHFIVSDEPVTNFDSINNLGLANGAGKFVFPIEKQNQWFSVFDVGKNIYAVKRSGKTGLFDELGQEVLSPVYDDIGKISSNLFYLKKDKKITLFHLRDGILTPFIYDRIEALNSNCFKIYENHRCGLIDTLGKVIVPIQYYSIEKFTDSIYVVQRASGAQKTGTNTTTGFEILTTKDTGKQAVFPSESILIDRTGKIILDLQLTSIGNLNKDLAQISNKNKKGYVNKKGELMLPPLFTETEILKSGFIKAREYGTGFFGLWYEGKPVIANKYNRVGEMVNGWVWVLQGIQYQYLNKDGKDLIITSDQAKKTYPALPAELFNHFEFWGATKEEKGLIRVCHKGLWGWIDDKGNEKISCRFGAVTPFINGHARVIIEQYSDVYVNLNGEIVLGR